MNAQQRRVLEQLEHSLGDLPAYEIARRATMDSNKAELALDQLVTAGVLSVEQINGLNYYTADSKAEVAALLADSPEVWFKNDRLDQLARMTA